MLGTLDTVRQRLEDDSVAGTRKDFAADTDAPDAALLQLEETVLPIAETASAFSTWSAARGAIVAPPSPLPGSHVVVARGGPEALDGQAGVPQSTTSCIVGAIVLLALAAAPVLVRLTAHPDSRQLVPRVSGSGHWTPRDSWRSAAERRVDQRVSRGRRGERGHARRDRHPRRNQRLRHPEDRRAAGGRERRQAEDAAVFHRPRQQRIVGGLAHLIEVEAADVHGGARHHVAGHCARRERHTPARPRPARATSRPPSCLPNAIAVSTSEVRSANTERL